MKTIMGTLVNATIVDAVHNLWELTLMIDDMATIKKYKVHSRYPFRNDEIRRFRLTLKGDDVIKIEPSS
jgi:hypothetical protein